MIKQIEAILLSSGNAQKLADFYKDVVGLQITEEIEVGEPSKTVSQKPPETAEPETMFMYFLT